MFENSYVLTLDVFKGKLPHGEISVLLSRAAHDVRLLPMPGRFPLRVHFTAPPNPARLPETADHPLLWPRVYTRTRTRTHTSGFISSSGTLYYYVCDITLAHSLTNCT